jgi:hypothetical protein
LVLLLGYARHLESDAINHKAVANRKTALVFTVILHYSIGARAFREITIVKVAYTRKNLADNLHFFQLKYNEFK